MHNVKDTLARLLAQEDLAVEHRGVDTAQFNVETRVLTLPIWQTAPVIVDSMISHEVGHALYTPNDWSFEGRVPMQFINVVEDIRVEKLMKRRYAGISKTFYRGYAELNAQDFFDIADKDISSLNLADRINLHFKIGPFLKVPFSEDEMVFVERGENIESFEDTIELAEDLYKFCKASTEKEKPDAEEPVQQNPDGSGADTMETEQETPFPESGESEETEEVESEEDDQGDSAEDTMDDLEIETDTSLSEALKDLAKELHNEWEEFHYIEAPNIDYKSFIVSNKEVWNHCEQVWDAQGYVHENFEICDSHYNQYKKSANQEINYLVKEFEMRKSATSYARATTSRTGVLDTSKLHTYKFNEDLFKKVTNLQEGKNHTLIFNLDWSGSMSDAIVATVKQLISLVSFCRKVNIDYRVYAFTDAWSTRIHEAGMYNQEADKLWIHPDFSFLELLRSDVNNSVHERQCRNLYRLAHTQDRNYYARFGCPRKLGLGGTPLNECIISMFDIAPMVKKETNCQKLHIINLTDGEGNPMYCSKRVSYRDGESHVLRRPINPQTILRDRKCGKTYRFSENAWMQTDIYVQNFRDRFPDVEIISIRLMCGRDWKRYSNYFIANYKQREEADRQWKKNKTYIDTHSKYSISYIMKTETIESSTDFDVSEDASKTQIRNAFKKSLGGKKANKQILSSFIKQIA